MARFSDEAKYWVDWTHTSNISYGDFLRAKEFEHSIRFAIDNQTQQLIASNEQLAAQGFSELADQIFEGLSGLSTDIQAVDATIARGTAQIVGALEWGFGVVIDHLEKLADGIRELVQLTKNPSATWSYELFDRARNQYRRGFHSEALESVMLAIDGFGDHVGFKTEFRFHELTGIIRLGSWLGDHPNTSTEVVNPSSYRCPKVCFYLLQQSVLSAEI